MKKLFLVIIAVLFALPVWGECDYKILKADILGVTTYRVTLKPGVTVYQTESLGYARERRDIETASCRALVDYRVNESATREAYKKAKWIEVK
jgi:hypothetical protein